MQRTTLNASNTSWLIALLLTALWAPGAQGYQYYDVPGVPDGDPDNGCVECHEGTMPNQGFRGGPPNANLHEQHKNEFGITTCNVCHPMGGGSTPVATYSSDNGSGLGCAGCHGRDYGETSPNSMAPKATGYGLRQYHANIGITPRVHWVIPTHSPRLSPRTCRRPSTARPLPT
jgi:hypothetical protein